MFGMGMGELIVIAIVALLVLGPNKIPEAAKAIGKGIRELRKHTRDLQQTVEQDETIGGAMREVRSALRGDPEPPEPPQPPEEKKGGP
jgi:Tat protein translocase TatB subunit